MGATSVHIREFDKRSDTSDLQKCVIELQDFERGLDPRIPNGAQIADDYVPQMLQRCRQYAGKVLLADVDGKVAGYATVMSKMRSDEIEDGDIEFGLIADLVVLKDYRKMGIGRRLLSAAEDFARERDVKWLRIGALAGNRVANDLYSSMGFAKYHIEREKDLTLPG